MLEVQVRIPVCISVRVLRSRPGDRPPAFGSAQPLAGQTLHAFTVAIVVQYNRHSMCGHKPGGGQPHPKVLLGNNDVHYMWLATTASTTVSSVDMEL